MAGPALARGICLGKIMTSITDLTGQLQLQCSCWLYGVSHDDRHTVPERLHPSSHILVSDAFAKCQLSRAPFSAISIFSLNLRFTAGSLTIEQMDVNKQSTDSPLTHLMRLLPIQQYFVLHLSQLYQVAGLERHQVVICRMLK
ncbi:MAG: hypothetical protein ALECFALPRED_011083 [Alectoria fallacina]|uniref:Uncharacterized protein n=1 Tax=Alectoria fallacina TaxID=1903189 RepID=A0A8H3F730_9LECA|nr:MAG: hypothetical protein ALECFALPRED_011083 [Alectoria fallacina]